MAHANMLSNYFRSAQQKRNKDRWIGAEIETFFAKDSGAAISIEQSCNILRHLVQRGWTADRQKAGMLTEISKGSSRIQYELGYPNIELSVAPQYQNDIVPYSRQLLAELYGAAEAYGAFPVFAPIFPIEQDYLVIPDERDATWLRLDGKKALSPLARISAVQFTIDVQLDEAIDTLNQLNKKRAGFLNEYPQDSIWREYVSSSPAAYRSDRYGGPSEFRSIEHYCEELSRHAVVHGDSLIPFEQARLCANEEIALFIRSVWWYFRLRRYGLNLCIEVRPLARRRDEKLQHQLRFVLDAMG